MPSRKKKVKKKTVKVSPLAALGVSAGLILAIFLVACLWPRGSSSERGSRVPPGTWRYGIDISHNNSGPIVWDSLYVMTDKKRRTVRNPFEANDIKPVSFVVVKATEGASFKDPDFKDNWRQAGLSGIKRGAYHFFRSSKDGEIQARNFISTVGCSKQLLNERALQWLSTVEKHYGKKPVVYASSSFIKDNLSKEISGNYPIWVAHYVKSRPSHDSWIWWQFTDKAVVKGVPGPVDLSVMAAD